MESNNVNWMQWVQFGQDAVTWIANTGQAFGFWGDDGSGGQSGGVRPPLGYEQYYGSSPQTPLQSGFGGVNLTTLLLIGAGIYLITKK